MEPQKKLINAAENCVDEALCGLARASGGLSLLRGHRVVLRSDLDPLRGKVALLSGGGSGHEPAHAGYVGAGMLSAAVAGAVFASPPPASVLAAILCLHSADAKTSAPAWPNLSGGCVSGRGYLADPTAVPAGAHDANLPEGPRSPVMRKALERVCSTLLDHQEKLNALDRASGDGDCGNTHAQAARDIQVWLQSHVVPGCPGQLLSALAALVQEKMGGSSGALYSLFLTAASGHMTEGQSHAAVWASAMYAGMEAVKRYGGADLGDRTMLDALQPAVEELMKLNGATPGGEIAVLKAAAQKAAAGADSTRGLAAKAGRASYVAAERLTLPDPGAEAVAAIFGAVSEALEEPHL